MAGEQFFPKLTTIITLDQLPESLGFVKDGLDTLFDGLYFRDLQASKNREGDKAFYSLKIITYKRIGFEIPGTGISLLLNPPLNTDPVPYFAELPITVSYDWEILKYARRFNISNFSSSPGEIFDLIKQITGFQDKDLLNLTIQRFIDNPTNPVDGFIDRINDHFSTSIPYPAFGTYDEQLDYILAQIQQVLGTNTSIVIFSVFLLVDSSFDSILERINELFSGLLGKGKPVDYLKELLIPKVNASLELGAGLEFPRNMLIPLDINGDPIPDPTKSILIFSGASFQFSTETGIGYNVDISASLNHPSQIGNTGLWLDLQNAKLDLSRTQNIPEAVADGRPDDFVGVYIESVDIGLPPFIKEDPMNPNPPTIKITGRRLLIGTGGISGTLGLETTGAGLCKTFGDKLKACFNSFDITFRQNSIISSNVNGTLIIPGFEDTMGNDAEININVHFGEDGDFQVTASEDQSITAIKIKDILSIELSSVFVGREDGRWFFGLSGAVNFEDLGGAIGNFIPDKIDIKKLIVWEDGKIELEGGKITLPKAVSLKLGPVELSITAVGLGSHEQEHDGILRQYKYFTFDGGINVNPGGVDASGNGITLFWTVDNDALLGKNLHLFMRIQSISIDIIIPGSAKPADAALLLSGFLAMKDTPNGTEYQGGVDFTLPKLKMGGSAAMRLNPKVPAFIIDVGLELSTPILLGSTGLGIYGFRALVGQRYVATKEAANVDPAEPWWKYYKAKIDPDYKEGIQVSKFDQTNGFSLGAGVSLATASDGGKAFSSKIFFLLSLPEVFLLQGQGQILKERIGLDTTQDPPFFALISITSTSVETAFGVNYKIPDDGDDPGSIATVDGVIEMGFSWANAFVWYINIGKDLPENRRIQVRLLDLFNAYFYFMLGNNGIRAGAGASFEVKKKFGPLRAELSAYLDTAARISKRPKEMGGSIQLGGSAGLYIFGFGFSIGASASLAAESAKPFIISGSVEVCVKVLKKDRCAKFKFTWTFRDELDLSETPLFKGSLSESGKALNMQTREPFALWTGSALPTSPNTQLDDYIVPLDSFIDIEFLKGVLPDASVIAKIGGNTMGSEYLEYVAPQRGKSDRVKHAYTLTALDILYHNGTSWQPFDVYTANTPLNLAPFVTTDLSTLKHGFWQYQAPNLHNKLRILGQNPLSYVSQGSGGLVVEDLGITVEEIFCSPDLIEKDCINFDTLEIPGQEYGSTIIPVNQLIWHEKFLFRVLGSDGSIINRPFNGYTNAIQLDAGSSLEIIFAEPQACITLQMQTLTSGATVSIYKRDEIPSDPNDNTEPEYTYAFIGSKTVLPTDDGKLNYENADNPVDRIVIEAGVCRPKGDLLCDDTITQQGTDLLALLNQLAVRNEFVSDKLSLDKEPYNVLWGGSSLYQPAAGCENPSPTWSVRNITDVSILILLSDKCDLKCELQLTRVNTSGEFNFKSITGFSNLRPDPEVMQAGENYCFLIDATLSNGQVFTLKGCGCWNIINCKPIVADQGLVVDEQITTEAQVFQTLLIALAQNKDLTANRLNLPSDSIYRTYLEDSGLTSGVSNEQKIVLRAIEQDEARKSLNVLITVTDAIAGTAVQEPGAGTTKAAEPSATIATTSFTLGLTTPRKEFSFRKIVDFQKLRVNSSNIQEGENKEFLIDALVKIGKKKVERVTLIGSSPINIANATVDTMLDPSRIQIAVDEPHYHAGEFECGRLTPEALDLEKFLHRLTETKYIFQPTGFTSNLFPDNNALFNGYFVGSTLYPYPINKADIITYTVENGTSTAVDFSLSGGQMPDTCNAHLEIIDSGGFNVTLSNLVSMFNLRMDEANMVDGANYSFLIDAIAAVEGQKITVTLRGTTCYKIVDCKENTAGFVCDVEMSLEAQQLEKSLNSFFQFRLFQNASATMYPGPFEQMYNGVFFDTVLYTEPLTEGLLVNFTRTSLTETLIAWNIADNESYDCSFQLELITATQTIISDLVQLHNLRPDPDNVIEGSNSYFLIDAYDQTGEIVTMRGNSCYSIVNCAKECSTYVYGLCVLDVPGLLFNATIPSQSSVDAEVQTIINSFNGSLQPVWRPDTNYAIRIQTKDHLSREGGGYLTEYNRTAVFGFRTMGPIGHFHQYKNDSGVVLKNPTFEALENQDKEDEFKLRGLLYYIDFPKCYPNADGQLINAKPLFYVDPKLLLYYTNNYVYEMLNGWDAYGGLQALNTEFTVTVIDPALDETIPGASNEQGVLSWTLSSLPQISEDITILNNMMTYGDPCSVTTIIDPQYPVSNFQLAALKPLKLYTAVFHLKYKRNSEPDFTVREVLRYPFQTSRYSDFNAQVQSWQLESESGATADSLFIVDKEFDAITHLQVAASVLNDTMLKDDPLRQEFGDRFNRLLEGGLKMVSIDPPVGTEFNILRDTLTNTVIGILVKNPEPFNDPKTPADVFTSQAMIQLTVNGGGVFKQILSKDYSQAFISTNTLDMGIVDGDVLEFTFRYVQYDGVSYVNSGTETVTFNINL